MLHMLSQRLSNSSDESPQSDHADRSSHAVDAAPQSTSGAPSPDTLSDPVLRATYDSILEVGVRRTTLADVSRRAGVSRMTVYRKYDDLQRLLSALLTVELAHLLDETITRNANRPTQREQLAHTASDTCAALAAHPIMQRVLAVDPEALLPLIVDRLGSTQVRALELMRESIIAGQSATGDGSVKSGDPDLMALTIVATAQSFVFSQRAIANADPLGHIYPELTAMVDGYLRPVSA